MSDTRLQIKNSFNQEHINHLKSLYKQENSIRLEIKFVKKKIKEGQRYISLRSLRDYEINWLLNVLRGNLIQNKDMIQIIREKLIIC